MKVIIINGPNLNLLGKREPSIYGNESFEAYLSALRSEFSELSIDYFQKDLYQKLYKSLLRKTSYNH